jgi:hypothetical protein
VAAPAKIVDVRTAARLMRSVTAVLQSYADRGVFRGFNITASPRGCRFDFLWLTRRPISLVFTPSRRLLVFDRLFPGADQVPGVVDAIRSTVRSASSANRPHHRRLDARRGKIVCRFADGHGSLRVSFISPDGAPTVRVALVVVNDVFLTLHECFPDYLITYFGASAE